MRLNEIKFCISLLLNKDIGEKILNEILRLKTNTVLAVSVTFIVLADHGGTFGR
jgi:hypothetical protein